MLHVNKLHVCDVVNLLTASMCSLFCSESVIYLRTYLTSGAYCMFRWMKCFPHIIIQRHQWVPELNPRTRVYQVMLWRKTLCQWPLTVLWLSKLLIQCQNLLPESSNQWNMNCIICKNWWIFLIWPKHLHFIPSFLLCWNLWKMPQSSTFVSQWITH